MKMDHLKDEFVLCRTDYFISDVFPIMDQLRRAGDFCDVTLNVGDKSFGTHRIVLAAAIPYFHDMFTNNMAKCRQQDITIQGIDAILTPSNVLDLRSLADSIEAADKYVDYHFHDVAMECLSLSVSDLLDIVRRDITT